MKKSPADRLKELREKRFETAKAAADAHGWNEVTYRSHESGMRNIPMTAARKYATAFRSSPGYILGLEAGGNSPLVNAVTYAPLVAIAAAGAFRVDDGLEIEGIQVPAVPRHDIPAGVQYSVQIDGQSVNKRIPDGAYAICAPYDRYAGGPQHGQLVHVIRERSGLVEHTIKELRYSRDGTQLFPVSTDPKHQEPLVLGTGEDGEIVRIHGVVIGVYQPL